MHPVNLISPHSDVERPAKTEIGICALTGVETDCVPRKSLFGRSFTDGASLTRPDSDLVGVDAFIALKYKWERMSSWLVTDSAFTKLDRVGVRDRVFSEPPDSFWCGYATTSYKKHGALRCPINAAGNRGNWLFENSIVNLSEPNTDDWWEALNEYLRAGISRPLLESPDIVMPHQIKTIGAATWIDFQRWSVNKASSSLYMFLCYLLPSQDELKKERLNAEKQPESRNNKHESQLPLDW